MMIVSSQVRIAIFSFLVSVPLGACDSGEVDTGLPYEIDTTVIIFPDGTTDTTSTPNGSDCIDLGAECVAPQTICESDDARADVVVDDAGNVIEVVCYPIEDDGSIIRVDNETVVATSPGDVVVVDNEDDGVDIAGDVDLAGDNTVVFGHSPSTAVIDGDVRLSGSSTIARGVRITGDLYMPGGSVSAIFVEVEGNVIVTGNGALLVSSVVHGTIDYAGSGFELVGNALQGGLDASAGLAVCTDNVEFDDLDANFSLDRNTEVTGPFICP